jgi:hypothetical protein
MAENARQHDVLVNVGETAGVKGVAVIHRDLDHPSGWFRLQ